MDLNPATRKYLINEKKKKKVVLSNNGFYIYGITSW